MNYILTHHYDTTPSERFKFTGDKQELETLCLYLTFLFEDITDVSACLETNDTYQILCKILNIEPLDDKIENLKFDVIDLYFLREMNIVKTTEELETKICETLGYEPREFRKSCEELLLLTESYEIEMMYP